MVMTFPASSFFPAGPDRRQFVDLEPHAVPEVMDESPRIALISLLLEKIDHVLVNSRAPDTGFYTGHPEMFCLAEGIVHIPDFPGRFALGNRTGHVGIIAGLLINGEDIDHDRLIRHERAGAGHMRNCGIFPHETMVSTAVHPCPSRWQCMAYFTALMSGAHHSRCRIPFLRFRCTDEGNRLPHRGFGHLLDLFHQHDFGLSFLCPHGGDGALVHGHCTQVLKGLSQARPGNWGARGHGLPSGRRSSSRWPSRGSFSFLRISGKACFGPGHDRCL